MTEQISLLDAPIYGDITPIPLSQITAGNNDRRVFDKSELEELADSIRKHGLIQPITVRPLGDNRYEIVAGERRYRAYSLLHSQDPLQWAAIPAMIKNLDDKQADAVMLLENIKRSNLNPLDEANAYDKRMKKWGLTIEEIADEAGVSKALVKGRLDLLLLREDIQHLIKSGNMTLNFAQCLKGLDHNYQMIALRYFQETTKPHVSTFKKLCQQLLEKQNQAALFDWDTFMQAPIEPEPTKQPEPIADIPTVDSMPIQETLPGMIYAPRTVKKHKRHIVPAPLKQQIALLVLVGMLQFAAVKG
jgi:ParB/RepB/Spo0J family partition protein